MYVEFFGHPYSGKTTLSRELAQALRQRGYNVREPTFSIYGGSLGTQVLRSVQTILAGVVRRENKFIDVSVEQSSLSDYLRLYLNGAVVHTLHERVKTGDSVFILDQGVTQLAWAMFIQAEEDLTQDKVLQTTSRLDAEDIVVLIDVNKSTIERRYEVDNNRHTRIDYLSKTYNLYRQMMDILESDIFPVKTYTITNNSPLPEVIEQVEAVSSAIEDSPSR